MQDYLAAHGARKVEANALVTRPEAGRALLRQTIAKYLPDDAPAVYQERLTGVRQEFRTQLRERLATAFADDAEDPEDDHAFDLPDEDDDDEDDDDGRF